MSAGVPAQRRKRAGVRPQARLAVGRGRPAGASPGSAGWRRGRSVRWARMATVSRTDEAIGAIVRVNIAAHAREESVRAPYLAATSVRGREPHKAISSRAPSPARDGFKPGSSRVRAGFERGSSAGEGRAARRRETSCAERRRTSCPDAAAFRRRVRKPAAHAGWQRRRRARARRNRTGHTGSLLGGSSGFCGCS